jgi:putative FmdB family regulatory protein
MPIFEFRCKKCDHVFEELVFSSNPDPADIICPHCGEKNADKLMSAFSSAGAASFGSSGASCGTSGFG